MQLSKRLRAVAALVTAGGAVADIGTDHAYIPIYLVQTGVATRAIAIDVNRGPLARAKEHIAQYGLEALIETRLSDGLAALQPGEADSIVIAGMGGALMARILNEGREKLCGPEAEEESRDGAVGEAVSKAGRRTASRACRELILQPQSEIWLVRAWLEQSGWQIVRENMICEDGKYYPMMRAERCVKETTGIEPVTEYDPMMRTVCCGDETGSYKGGGDKADGGRSGDVEGSVADMAALRMNEMELRFGPLLLRERHPVLREFLLHERKLNLRILASLNGQSGAAAVARAEEVRGELRLVEEALNQIRV